MQIQNNASLLPYNTFHINCKAKHFAEISSPADFIALLHTPEWKTSHKKLFIGGGSNMLLTGEVFDGLVVHNGILGKEKVTEQPGEVFLKIGGGENWSDFVRRTIDQGLYGIENLVSIPGNVAAAPIQNIGAYGMDISHAIVSVGGINLKTGTYETVSHKECLFAYRDSVFKHALKDEFFIIDVTLRLQYYDKDTYMPVVNYGNVMEELHKRGIPQPSPHDVASAIATIRANKLPDRNKVGTAGSFYKNIVLSEEEYNDFVKRLHALKPDLQPEAYPLAGDYFKIPTGRILDHALGFRGYREGKVGCRENQALCLVNYGGATGQDIVKFSQKLQKICQEKLGIAIEPEVNFIQ